MFLNYGVWYNYCGFCLTFQRAIFLNMNFMLCMCVDAEARSSSRLKKEKRELNSILNMHIEIMSIAGIFCIWHLHSMCCHLNSNIGLGMPVIMLSWYDMVWMARLTHFTYSVTTPTNPFLFPLKIMVLFINMRKACSDWTCIIRAVQHNNHSKYKYILQ